MIVSPTSVWLNSQSGAPPTPPLQAGKVLDALVVAVLDNGNVRLTVGNLVMEAVTTVPLVPGTTVRLAVQATSDGGIQLVIVDPASAELATTTYLGSATIVSRNGGSVPPGPPAGSGQQAATGSGETPAVIVDIGGHDGSAKIAAQAQTGIDGPVLAGSDADIAAHAQAPAVALSAAVRVAAAQQNGLSQVFADAAAAATSPAVPQAVRAAATQLLALQLPLQGGIVPSGSTVGSPALPGSAAIASMTILPAAVKAAFANSGLFLEANLAAQVGDASASAVPPSGDLKAALVVLREVLKTWLDGGSAGPPAADQALAVLEQGPSIVPGAHSGPEGAGGANAPAIAPANAPANAPMSAGAAAAAATANAAATAQAALLGEAADQAALRAGPPPPYRGGPTTGQPPSASSIPADATPREIGDRLVHATDAALARQTLLQAASLDHADPQAARQDPSGPRWNFEIPFATPQGTAVAQFEIARDGGNAPAEGIKPVWRARFTVDIEPMGPVHAQIAVTGTRTAVTMWAERGETATQLRDSSAQLAQALASDELAPGDVLVRNGAPPQPRLVPAPGRFIDRAS